jgi:NTE family protein
MAAPGALMAAALRPWRVRPGALAAAVLPAGTVPTDVIRDSIGPLFGSRWPTEPLWVCALRVSDSARVVFGRDRGAVSSVGLAVAASCAIPGWFAPVEIDGVRYVDGGAHSPTNADVLAGLGLDLVVVSSPLSAAGRALPTSAGTAVRRYCRALLDAEALRLRRGGTPVLAFQPTADDQRVMGLNAMDHSRRATVATAARESTLRRLERPDVRRRLSALGL